MHGARMSDESVSLYQTIMITKKHGELYTMSYHCGMNSIITDFKNRRLSKVSLIFSTGIDRF